MTILTSSRRRAQCHGLVALVLFLLTNQIGSAEVRRWSSENGTFNVRAELLGANDTAVTLKKTDGKVVTVPLEKLSKADRDYVRGWQLDRKQGQSAKPIPGIVPDVLDQPVDLLAKIKPTRDVKTGTWKQDGEALVSSTQRRTTLEIPHKIQGQYQLKMVVEREPASGALNIGIVVGGRHQAIVIFDYGREMRSGLAWVDEKNEPANPTYYRKQVLKKSQPAEVVLTVHAGHLRVTCDGRTVVDWCGNPRRLTLHPNWKVPKDQIFLSTWSGAYRVSKLEYRSIRESELSDFEPRGTPDTVESVALIEHPLGHGSGFLAAPNLLVTNHHVIEGASATDLKVFFPEAREPIAVNSVLYEDADRDIAVLSVKTARVPLAVAYDGHFPKDQQVRLIGNPSVGGGVTLRNAVVKGNVKATVRIDEMDFLQIDATINPGSSGGPIVNELGQVVGVIAMKATDEGEKLIREGLARLDDSFKKNSKQRNQEGVAFGIPSLDLAKALDKARGLSPQQAAHNTQLHQNRVVLTRLATLAGIRMLQALVNVSDALRRDASSNGQSADSVPLIPPREARAMRAALESDRTTKMIALLQKDMEEHLKTISASPHLSPRSKRNLNSLHQRVREVEKFANRSGSDYRRFSASITRFQKDLSGLIKQIKEEQ